MTTEDVIYFYKYFNLTTFSEKEVDHNTYYLLEIHINNSIVGRRNAAEEYLNHSCLVAMTEDQNDCMNISLQLRSYVECKLQRSQKGNQARNNINLAKNLQ